MRFVRTTGLFGKPDWKLELIVNVLATIIGIWLTFGIDSCVDSRREKREAVRSLLQAVDNLGERFEYTQEWIDIVENQNHVYHIADSINVAGGRLPDSICDRFRMTMPYVQISAFDHDYEKIFRGSYQFWQLHNNDKNLVFYISQCYDGLNLVESNCREMCDGMLQQIGICNASKQFYRMDNRRWTLTLLNDAGFQYYMAVRGVKSSITANIFRQARNDYDSIVMKRSERLRND